MIQVVKNGKNPTMRHLGRVHGIGVNFLHQEIGKSYCSLGHISSENMCGDIHTKAFSDRDREVWDRARRNINVISEKEHYLIGRPGPGYVNMAMQPQEYAKRTATQVTQSENAIDLGNDSAMAATENDEHTKMEPKTLRRGNPQPQSEGPQYVRITGGKLTIGADCAGIGAGIEAITNVVPHSKGELHDRIKRYGTRTPE